MKTPVVKLQRIGLPIFKTFHYAATIWSTPSPFQHCQLMGWREVPANVRYGAGGDDGDDTKQKKKNPTQNPRNPKNRPPKRTPKTSLPSEIANPYTSNCKAHLLTHAGSQHRKEIRISADIPSQLEQPPFSSHLPAVHGKKSHLFYTCLSWAFKWEFAICALTREPTAFISRTFTTKAIKYMKGS